MYSCLDINTSATVDRLQRSHTSSNPIHWRASNPPTRADHEWHWASCNFFFLLILSDHILILSQCATAAFPSLATQPGMKISGMKCYWSILNLLLGAPTTVPPMCVNSNIVQVNIHWLFVLVLKRRKSTIVSCLRINSRRLLLLKFYNCLILMYSANVLVSFPNE